MSDILPPSCNLVIFGATGDLALKKLFPSLLALAHGGLLGEDTPIIASSRTEQSNESFRELIANALKKVVCPEFFQDYDLSAFLDRITYVRIDSNTLDDYDNLTQELGDRFKQQTTIYYLSTSSYLFSHICQNLNKKGLVAKDSRVILEKPIGVDLESSRLVNEHVGKIFDEENIYRIDHYLGKETVQNLIALRFANAFFEPLWQNSHIDNVQITVAEDLGIGGRWTYYNNSGALRDMIQNHLLQLLCLVAMEVPHSVNSSAVRYEKLKVLKSLRPIFAEDLNQKVVRAQYTAGNVSGVAVPCYNDESDAKETSNTESFVAIKAEIDNWRWAGVPFYLRTGKRLNQKYSEIVIQFKDIPHSIFPKSTSLQANKLIIRLQPDESIHMSMMNKLPGIAQDRIRLMPVTLDLNTPMAVSDVTVPDAYERLLYDVMQGNSTLFVHRDEVEAAWTWCDRILQAWQQSTIPPSQYQAGSSGPQAAFELVARDGRSWHEPTI